MSMRCPREPEELAGPYPEEQQEDEVGAIEENGAPPIGSAEPAAPPRRRGADPVETPPEPDLRTPDERLR